MTWRNSADLTAACNTAIQMATKRSLSTLIDRQLKSRQAAQISESAGATSPRTSMMGNASKRPRSCRHSEPNLLQVVVGTLNDGATEAPPKMVKSRSFTPEGAGTWTGYGPAAQRVESTEDHVEVHRRSRRDHVEDALCVALADLCALRRLRALSGLDR